MGSFAVGSVAKKKVVILSTKKFGLLFIASCFLSVLFFGFNFNPSEENNSEGQESGDEDASNFPKELTANSLQLIQHPSEHSPYTKWYTNKARKNRPKKILIWNAYWESTALWHKIFYEIVYKQCPQSNCVMTVDKSELESSDAVLFHLADIPKENYSFPMNRRQDQIWIGMTYEPPYILKLCKLNFTMLNGVFNRTMSYRSDSDVVVRHGTYFKVQNETEFPYFLSDWVGSHKSVKEKNYAEGKRRIVSWFASSRGCKSSSRREKYVKEMQKHVPVDIFGGCGPFKCGTQKTMRNPYKVEHDDCYLLVSVAYKFVLAFENSICDDYVTEKLYNHLKLNVVPVVFGGANYSQFAPPNSYIDASKYTPKELAEYLQLLDKNDTLYNEYYKWKEKYYIASHDGIPLACDLCEQMHNPNWLIERKVYNQFDQWIEGGCRKGWYAQPSQ